MRDNDVDQLNGLLKGELAAVESYKQALTKIADQAKAEALKDNLASHQERAGKLRQAIEELGGTAELNTGSWGSITKWMTTNAGKMGDTAILTALEEGEDLGEDDYEWRLIKIHGKYHKLVRDDLFPQQKKTHNKLIQLVHNPMWPPMTEQKEV